MSSKEEQKSREASAFAERVNCVSGSGQLGPAIDQSCGQMPPQVAEQCAEDPSSYDRRLRENARAAEWAIAELQAAGYNTIGVPLSPVNFLRERRDTYRKELAAREHERNRERERAARPRTITIRTVLERVDFVECVDADGEVLWWVQGSPGNCRVTAQHRRRPNDKIRDETADGAKCAIPDVLGASKPGAQARNFRANPDFGGV